VPIGVALSDESSGGFAVTVAECLDSRVWILLRRRTPTNDNLAIPGDRLGSSRSQPDKHWMAQVARNLPNAEDGFLVACTI
jgi:hypothetical protein